jgi:hypothetical protein
MSADARPPGTTINDVDEILSLDYVAREAITPL